MSASSAARSLNAPHESSFINRRGPNAFSNSAVVPSRNTDSSADSISSVEADGEASKAAASSGTAMATWMSTLHRRRHEHP